MQQRSFKEPIAQNEAMEQTLNKIGILGIVYGWK